MEEMLERILIKELDNTDKIHMFYSDSACCWAVFQQSALNLAGIIPGVACCPIDECFVDGEVKLTCIRVNSGYIKRYALLLYCTLVSDDYIELQNKPVVNDE